MQYKERWIEKEEVKLALQNRLAGVRAHGEMTSYLRPSAAEVIRRQTMVRHSAVMLLLFPWKDTRATVLIARPEYTGPHSGQVSLPGGKMEPGDTDLMHTALREMNEEIGIDPKGVEILGQLTEVFIPPSGFVVTPFVGWLNDVPEFHPDDREVAEVLVEPMPDLFNPNRIARHEVFIKPYQKMLSVPSFAIGAHVVWGATAMMLHEFRTTINPRLLGN